MPVGLPVRCTAPSSRTAGACCTRFTITKIDRGESMAAPQSLRTTAERLPQAELAARPEAPDSRQISFFFAPIRRRDKVMSRNISGRRGDDEDGRNGGQQTATFPLHECHTRCLDSNGARLFAAPGPGGGQGLQAGAYNRNPQHLPLLLGQLRDNHVWPRRQVEERQ